MNSISILCETAAERQMLSRNLQKTAFQTPGTYRKTAFHGLYLPKIIISARRHGIHRKTASLYLNLKKKLFLEDHIFPQLFPSFSRNICSTVYTLFLLWNHRNIKELTPKLRLKNLFLHKYRSSKSVTEFRALIFLENYIFH